nr:hypothetical protein CFP56_24110 [Quercus suber]
MSRGKMLRVAVNPGRETSPPISIPCNLRHSRSRAAETAPQKPHPPRRWLELFLNVGPVAVEFSRQLYRSLIPLWPCCCSSLLELRNLTQLSCLLFSSRSCCIAVAIASPQPFSTLRTVQCRWHGFSSSGGWPPNTAPIRFSLEYSNLTQYEQQCFNASLPRYDSFVDTRTNCIGLPGSLLRLAFCIDCPDNSACDISESSEASESVVSVQTALKDYCVALEGRVASLAVSTSFAILSVPQTLPYTSTPSELI